MLQNKSFDTTSNLQQDAIQNDLCSASDTLRNYIENYEQRQIVALAKSITNLCTETPLQRHNISIGSSALSDEIKMAQSLLPYTSQLLDVANMSADQLIIEDSNAQISNTFPTSSRTSANRLTLASSIQSHSPHSPRERKRTRRHIASTDPSFMRESSRRTSSRLCNSCSVDPASVTSKVEDLQQTWRLVDDLKADLASSNSGRTRNSPDKSLKLLIERLTATARRKEAKLNETINSSGMKITDIIPLRATHRLARIYDSCSEEEFSKDLLDFGELNVSESASHASSCDVIDDAINLIDRRKSNYESGPMTSHTPLAPDQCETVVEPHRLDSDLSPVNNPYSTSSSYRDFTPNVARIRQMQKFVKDCLAEATTTDEIISKEHPVEALKSMISTLQSLSMKEDDEETENDVVVDFSGHGSLHKAMNHLENMKKIIQN